MLRQLFTDPLRNALAVGCAPACADDRDGLLFTTLKASSYEECDRGIGDLAEEWGILLVRDQDEADAQAIEFIGELHWIGACTILEEALNRRSPTSKQAQVICRDVPRLILELSVEFKQSSTSKPIEPGQREPRASYVVPVVV